MNKKHGFTIVELIVVIVVIGILAGVSIVGYGAWRKGIEESTLKSDLGNAAAAMMNARTWDNMYPSVLPATFSASEGVNISGGSTDNKTYCIQASSVSTPSLVFHVMDGSEEVNPGVCPPPQAWSWTYVTSGQNHTCGISNGKAYCWGMNGGRLGNGSTANSSKPVEVGRTGPMAGKTVSAISAGGSHTCAIAQGKIYCWGNGMYGRLGNGDTSASTQVSPVEVVTSGGLSGKTVTTISAGNEHTCAIADGKAFCWGRNSSGAIGQGNSSTDSSTYSPLPVVTTTMIGTVTAISAGNSYTCAIADGKAFCWGHNSNGRLGTGAPADDQNKPTAVYTSSTVMTGSVTQITTGSQHACAFSGSVLYCWGAKINGKIGNGTSTGIEYNPTRPTSNNYEGRSLSAGADHTCQVFTYMNTDGRVICWGEGAYGKLGNNSVSNETAPKLMAAGTLPAGKVMSMIAAGGSHTCALVGVDVYCWGSNSYGQLGLSGPASSLAPVLVTGL